MSVEWVPTDLYLTKRLSKMIHRIDRIIRRVGVAERAGLRGRDVIAGFHQRCGKRNGGAVT